MSKTESMYLNRNATYKGTQFHRGAEIPVDHPAFNEFKKDGWLVESKALSEHEPEALASSLDEANRTIAELQKKLKIAEDEKSDLVIENKSLKNDLGDAIEELAKATTGKGKGKEVVQAESE